MRLVLRIFFRRVEISGAEKIPASRPVIFVLNHPNGLLDPLVLMAGLGRHVRFLAKSTFFGNPVGRWLMGAFGALPVYRQRFAWFLAPALCLLALTLVVGDGARRPPYRSLPLF